MVDMSRFYRPEVTSEMLRMVTPNRPSFVERPLDPEERAAIEREEIARAIAQARNEQRLQEIQTRRPGFQTLMGYGARQANPISQARASEAGMALAQRQLEHPLYRRYVENQITQAANVQEPQAVDIARMIMGARAAPSAAPVSAPVSAPATTSTTAIAPATASTSPQGEIGQPPVGFDRYLPEPDLFVPPSSSPVARAVQVARQAAGVPLPPQRPDALALQPPSHEAAMVARQDNVRRAWDRYNESGSAADFVRASALMQANMPERTQEADGGAIKAKGGSGKPDAIHKALEIIHHLLMRER